MGRGGGGRGGFRGQGGRRQRGNTPMNNRAQNAQTNAVASQLGLTPKQAHELHDAVTGQGWGYREILEEAKKMFGK